ncbi:hypothetical protein [Syntrophomonas curvata]
MNKFYVADKNHYTRYWPVLTILFIGAVLAWWQVSSSLAAVLAAAGFLFMLINDRRGKSKEGDSIEVLDRCIIFNEGGQSSSIAFTDIKKVKYTSTLSPGNPAIVIETGINKRNIQPSDYDKGGKLLQQLEAKFTAFHCPVVK